MDIEQLYTDYNIPHQTEGHKHCRPGWVNVECPFCVGNPGLHLGATLDGKIFYCWRCGIHYPDQVIAKLLHINMASAKKLIIDYAGVPTLHKETKMKIRIKAHKLPSDTGPLTQTHAAYLKARKFDADIVSSQWDLLSTGPVSVLDGIFYGHRILAPIYWEGKQVTFQTRDVTNKSPFKYLACPEDREIIKHKHIIYKHPDFHNTTAICCEGITDVWRFGKDAAIATFGIEYTRYQVRLIANMFKRVAVCFDDEPQAIKQANELISDLRFRKVDAFRIDIVGDPGALPQTEADYIVKQIIH